MAFTALTGGVLAMAARQRHRTPLVDHQQRRHLAVERRRRRTPERVHPVSRHGAPFDTGATTAGLAVTPLPGHAGDATAMRGTVGTRASDISFDARCAIISPAFARSGPGSNAREHHRHVRVRRRQPRATPSSTAPRGGSHAERGTPVDRDRTLPLDTGGTGSDRTHLPRRPIPSRLTHRRSGNHPPRNQRLLGLRRHRCARRPARGDQRLPGPAHGEQPVPFRHGRSPPRSRSGPTS